MTTMKYAIAMLAASGVASAASHASATTTSYNYSGLSDPQNVDILGTTEYTYGFGSDIKDVPGSYMTPVGSALTGSYTQDYMSPVGDTYTSTAVKTGTYDGDAGLKAVYPGDSYLNLQFTVGGQTYLGTAEFTATDAEIAPDFFAAADFTPGPADVTLDSITYGPEVSSAPEPAAWALLIAGLGVTGATLRNRRRQLAAIG